MLTLKKLFAPEVQDICPNCAEACTITDVLCPKCGRNLDVLFERFPDSEVTTKPNRIAKTLMNPQVIKGWSLVNSAILVASLLAPWIAFYSDVIVVSIQFHYVFSFQILLFPIFALTSQRVFPLGGFLPSFGSSLIAAAAPAIAIYYSFHGVRTVFNMKAGKGIPISRFIPAMLRLMLAGISLALIDSGVGFNSYVSPGYILAIIGLLSACVLELIVPILDSKQIKRKTA